MFRPKLSLEDFQSVLKGIITARYRPYAGALVSFAHAPGAGDGAGLVACRWEFVDELTVPRAAVRYPALILEERWVPMEDALGELLRVLRREAALGGCMLREPVSELEKVDPSRETFTGWREATWEASLKREYQSDQTPVVAKGLRPYPSVSLAVNDFVWRQQYDPRWSLSLFGLDKLRVLLPDTRARIRKASWVSSTLILQNDRNADSDEVELQGVILEGKSATVLDPRAVEPEVTWGVPAEADFIELYLIHRDGTLLSHHKLTRGGHYSARPGEFAVRERAEEEIRQGEGERVEYKPFIARGDRKEHEIIRTVVAFSNSFGGRIYIGVEDDGTPQGEGPLTSIGKASAERSLALIVERITKLVREKIKPVPDVHVSPTTVFGSPVIVVDILAGEDAPYSTFENDVFVRSGATNRKPDPRTELPSIIERAREQRERRERQERLDAWGASSYQKGDDG